MVVSFFCCIFVIEKENNMTHYFYNPKLEKDGLNQYWVTVYKYKWWYRFTKYPYPRPVVTIVEKTYENALIRAKVYIEVMKDIKKH